MSGKTGRSGRKPMVAERDFALEFLRAGDGPDDVAYVLGISSLTVRAWRRGFVKGGLLQPTKQQAAQMRVVGTGERLAAARRRAAEARACRSNFSFLPPAAREWLRRGWGEFWERETAARIAGTDLWSRRVARLGSKAHLDEAKS